MILKSPWQGIAGGILNDILLRGGLGTHPKWKNTLSSKNEKCM